MSLLTRRAFLEATAATALATQFKPASGQTPNRHSEPYPENGNLIPDDGWHLWIDEHAEWKNDTIYLPEDVDIKTLPTNAPVGGWDVLTPAAGKQITLPTSVEQHFWGKFGSRPYTPEEYRYAADDPIPQNGAYFGVSWWYRNIDIPASMRGKRIFLHIRGAHLRAEVYLNQKLVGYSIMEELPFEADLTAAANPGGENHLAIRITNPFGRFDWVDGLNAQWGTVKLYRSHGFGALDRGMTISAVGDEDARILDAWILNRLESRTFEVRVRVLTSLLAGHITASEEKLLSFLKVEIIDSATGKVVPAHFIKREVGGEDAELGYKLTLKCATAGLWDLDSPKLYQLRLSYQTRDHIEDTRTIAFGFRSFGPSGLGTNALFRLNGRRIKLYSSISWGFWGLNGMFPTPELAEKEVTQAKKLGLNCLNFHRNLAKEDVLRAHDRLGLLRYMEPGAGKLAIGAIAPSTNKEDSIASPGVRMLKPKSEADKFAQRYMFTKCVEMVKAFRSHPSVIQYTLQNEIGADLKNPDTIAILEAMHKEDPSRSVVLNDGFSPPPRSAAQAWFEPWNDKLHRSDEEEWGGWWNNHQGAGDQWYDEFYKSPTEFTYGAPYRNVLTEFGEMEGCATPDNHSLMIHQITDTYKRYGGDSYDLTDHQEIVAAYDKFLDKWGFRPSFPATEHLWLALGAKCYDTWQNYMENARISDDLDFAVISGWESTAIENHSGIVDNLRNFKSDPSPIAQTLQPIHPIAKQRSACVALGKRATFDLYLINDTPQPATGTLSFTAVTPSGKLLRIGTFPVPAAVPDQFSYLVQEGFETPPLTEEGRYRFKLLLSSAPLSTQAKDIWVTNTTLNISNPHFMEGTVPSGVQPRVAFSGITKTLRTQLSTLLGAPLQEFVPGQKYDAIVTSGLTDHASATQNSGDATGLETQPTVLLKPHPPEPGETESPINQLGHIDPAILEAVRAGTPLLAIPQADTLSEGVAKQLAAAGAFTYHGTVGDFRAPWMGNWYFVRKHPIFAGLPVDQVMGIHYQAKGRQSNGLLIDKHPDGAPVEIIAAYSRDHDRNIGAGTFTTKLGSGKLLYQRVPELHPVLQQRFLSNALAWLTT